MSEMITIPKAEYDRLIAASEDASDIRAIAAFKARLERGDEEMLPAELVDRMIAGENLLKLWREHRGLSQAALARTAEVNRVQINDIEAGRSKGSVETLRKLASALDIMIDDLV